MSRRLSDSAGLKGVTTIRNGESYAVTLPKFTPLPNASTISISADKIHEEFRKLTPKQRIAVLTVKDPNIACKLHGISNSLWAKSLQEMRNTVGGKGTDDDASIRQFINNFEYFFGGTDSDSEALTEDEDGEKKPLLNRRKRESSIVSSVSRPINSTFSYTSSDPSVFRPKLTFMTTRDVVAVMIKNSKDFLSSQARARCRILQRPEMWSKIVESTKSDDEISAADYEAAILQLMEFRLMYEYLNGGSGGDPFANIRRAYPSSEETWEKKDKQLKEMEEGPMDVQSTAAPTTEVQTPIPVVSQPKRTKKQKMMEKIAAAQAAAAAAVVVKEPEPSSGPESDTSEDADTLVMNHRRKRLGSSDSTVMPPPAKVEVHPVMVVDEIELEEDSEWTQVGVSLGGPQRSRKPSGDVNSRTRKSSVTASTNSTTPNKAVAPLPAVTKKETKALRQLAAAHREHKFRLWVQSRPGTEYVCDSWSLKAVPKATFIHVVSKIPLNSPSKGRFRESPF